MYIYMAFLFIWESWNFYHINSFLFSFSITVLMTKYIQSSGRYTNNNQNQNTQYLMSIECATIYNDS